MSTIDPERAPWEWRLLGEFPPPQLATSRLELHWGCQLAAAVGNCLLERRPDDSQSSLRWDDTLGALVSEPAGEGKRFAAALRLEDLGLLLVDEAGELSRMPLTGRSIRAGLDWLGREIEVYTGQPLESPLRLREYDLPHHAVAKGGLFGVQSPGAMRELGRYYSNADHGLQAVAAANEHASPVRCWPHHFDIATLVTLDPQLPAEEARSIGVGLSPGDGSYTEPYWYVNPWPHPEPSALPALSAPGRWHTAGWVGAVLTASEVAAAGAAGRQEAMVADFQRDALDACRRVLAAGRQQEPR